MVLEDEAAWAYTASWPVETHQWHGDNKNNEGQLKLSGLEIVRLLVLISNE